MNTDPKPLLNQLRHDAECGVVSVVTPEFATWILAQFKYRDDRIEALTKLVKPPEVVSPPPPKSVETICQEADRLVSSDRQQQYGPPWEDFQRTAAMWEPILGLPLGAISPEHVGMCMIAVKLSRLCQGYKHDTAVDIAGYAKCISLICERT